MSCDGPGSVESILSARAHRELPQPRSSWDHLEIESVAKTNILALENKSTDAIEMKKNMSHGGDCKAAMRQRRAGGGNKHSLD